MEEFMTPAERKIAKKNDKIDKYRDLIGLKMSEFVRKLGEWSITNVGEDNPTAEFLQMINLLRSKNLQLLCKFVGQMFTPVADQIRKNDYTIFEDPEYLDYIQRVMSGDDIDSNIDFRDIFNSEQGERSEEIRNKFWEYMTFILKAYEGLTKIDPEMPMYTM